MAAPARSLSALGIRAHSRARSWAIGLSVLAAVCLLGVAGYFFARGRGAGSGESFDRVAITRGTLNALVTATGTLRATNTVQVGAEVSGRVTKVYAEPNQPVRAGETLVQLDATQLRAQVREAEANVAAAQAALSVAQTSAMEASRTAQRATAMHAGGLLPESEREQAESAALRSQAEVASARARLRVAQASLERMQEGLARSTIVSPIDGVVLTRTVEPGQAIAAQFQTPILFEVANDLRVMQLRIDVDEADVGDVREGQRATFTVDAYPTRTFNAVIQRVNLAPSTTQGVVSYEAILAVENAERLLRPGMTATATVITQTHPNVLLVPDRALRFAPPTSGFGPRRPTAPGPAVWTLAGETPSRHAVRVIASDGSQTAVEGDDIHEGMRVIVGARQQTP